MAGLLVIALLVGWLAVAVWLATRLTGKLESRPLRFALMISIVFVLVALPVADEIIGGFQFRALCRDNAELKIDAEKIRGKTVLVVVDPANRDVENSLIRIYYSRFSYRDVNSNEELATYSRYVAVSGWLMRALAMGNALPPLTIHPSACNLSAQGDLSKTFGFTYQTRVKEK